MSEESEALVPVEQPPTGLFATHDPVDVIQRATRVADALKGVIVDRGLVSRISNREYPNVEAWTLLGSMLGVFPRIEWSRETEDGWEARCVVVTRAGEVIGAGEAMCTRSEATWKNRDDYALRGMAQTRAISRAMRAPLGFVMRLAGYEGTSAEEVPAEGFPDRTEGDLGSLACPVCGVIGHLRKDRAQERWYCWKRQGGCGANFNTHPATLAAQKAAGENPDLPRLQERRGHGPVPRPIVRNPITVEQAAILDLPEPPPMDPDMERLGDSVTLRQRAAATVRALGELEQQAADLIEIGKQVKRRQLQKLGQDPGDSPGAELMLEYEAKLSLDRMSDRLFSKKFADTNQPERVELLVAVKRYLEDESG